MAQLKIKLRPHGSGNWREGVVLDQRRGSYYVDFKGSFDWVSHASHELVWT